MRLQIEARSSERGSGSLASASRSATGGSSLAAASASSRSLVGQRDPIVGDPARLLGNLAERGIFSRSDAGSRSLPCVSPVMRARS